MRNIIQVFDFDGNVAHLPTKIFGHRNNHPVSLTSEEYSACKNLSEYTFSSSSFRQFDDDALLKSHVQNAKLGVSFPDLVECVEKQISFCILTARGNSPEALYWAVKYLLDKEEIKYDKDYLFLNYFLGVSYPLYRITGNIAQDKALNAEKLITRGNFTTVTFSDDCVSNCRAVHEKLSSLNVNFLIYHTGEWGKTRYELSFK